MFHVFTLTCRVIVPEVDILEEMLKLSIESRVDLPEPEGPITNSISLGLAIPSRVMD